VKTLLSRRPATWARRERLIAAVVAGVFVLGMGLWWVTGADDRRTAAACDLYQDQRAELATSLVEAGEAADRAEAAGGSSTIGSFDDIDTELNALRRWQSTTPRLDEALGEEADGEVATALAEVTDAAAELQRLIEDEPPVAVRAGTADLDERLSAADDACGA